MKGDVTITFRASDGYTLPDAALQLISMYCGPLLPDQRGVLTMVLPPYRWAEIQAAIDATNPTAH